MEVIGVLVGLAMMGLFTIYSLLAVAMPFLVYNMHRRLREIKEKVK